MAEIRRTFDVFISHAARDAEIALAIEKAFRESGLEAVSTSDLGPGENASDALWEALTESRAFVIVLSSKETTPNMMFEFGAAKAWNKPIFGVVTNSSAFQLPSGLSGIRLYPAERIEDVIRAVKETGQELTDDDRASLASVYSEIGMTVDQLAMNSGELGKLVKRFSTDSGKVVSGERLLSELLRMRKQGLLTNHRHGQQSKRRKTPA